MRTFVDTYGAASEFLSTMRKGKKGTRKPTAPRPITLFRSLDESEKQLLEQGNLSSGASIRRISIASGIAVEERKRQFQLFLYWRSNSTSLGEAD